MSTDTKNLLWTVSYDSNEELTTITIARSSKKLSVKKIPYTPEQIACFYEAIQNLCYEIEICDYSEDENLGIRFDETTIIKHESIDIMDCIIEGNSVIGFVPDMDEAEMIPINEPEKTVWSADSYHISGYTYEYSEYTYKLVEKS